MDKLTQRVMLGDAIFDAAFGVLLFFSPWLTRTFFVLGLPNPNPEIYTQFCGGLLVLCGFLLLRAAFGKAEIAKPVARGMGVVNAFGALLILGWIISGQLNTTGLIGTVLLLVISALLVGFSFFELRYGLSRKPHAES